MWSSNDFTDEIKCRWTKLWEISALCFKSFGSARATSNQELRLFSWLTLARAVKVNVIKEWKQTGLLCRMSCEFLSIISETVEWNSNFFAMITSLPRLKGPRGSPAGEILPRHASDRRKKVRTIELRLLLRSYGIAYSVGWILQDVGPSRFIQLLFTF